MAASGQSCTGVPSRWSRRPSPRPARRAARRACPGRGSRCRSRAATGAALAALDALIEDAEVAVDVGGVELAELEAVAGERDELLEQQLARRHVLVADPPRGGRRGRGARRRRSSPSPGRTPATWRMSGCWSKTALIRPNQKAALATSSTMRRAGGQHAVLDPQVGLALGDAVAGAVPAVDGAVEEAQRLQRRHAARGEDVRSGSSSTSAASRTRKRETSSWKISSTLSSTQPRPKRTRGLCSRRCEVARRRGVDRLLEEGDAGLAPEPLAEQQRRVGGRGEHRRGHRLGEVVERARTPPARSGSAPGSWCCTPPASRSRGVSLSSSCALDVEDRRRRRAAASSPR